jgi:hypothetical protein
MPSIPVDVLREILEHVDKNNLATICRVNKTCCSCSQDVLYREINYGGKLVIRTLAQSTDLARRVRSFETYSNCEELATALQNMSSLRRLVLDGNNDDASILDGCTFKLDSLNCVFGHSESLQKFLNGQSSLTKFEIFDIAGCPPPFEETFLPNLTQVKAKPSWVHMLVPGRPVREVILYDPCDEDYPIDFSIFTLSTAPIQKLEIAYRLLYPTPGSHLASIFPSLEHLVILAHYMDRAVRIHPLYLPI